MKRLSNRFFVPVVIYWTTFFTVCWSSQFAYSQPLAKQDQILTLSPSELQSYRIHEISGNGLALISENKDLYVYHHIEDGVGKTSLKEFILSSDQFPVEMARFSLYNRYVIIRIKKGEKTSLNIYDIQTQNTRTIEHDTGNVINATISPTTADILYEVRIFGESPKIYLLEEYDSEPILVAEGIGARWSPDGKWFFVRTIKDSGVKLKEKYFAGKISKSEYLEKAKTKKTRSPDPAPYWIYSADGEPILELEDRIHWIQWSPTSDKLVVQKYGEISFHIVYLKEHSNKLDIERVYHFPGFPPSDKVYASASRPIWSPDGSKIAFIKIDGDGHYDLGWDVWILEDNTYTYYPITNSKDIRLRNLTWATANELYVRQSSQGFVKLNKLELTIPEK